MIKVILISIFSVAGLLSDSEQQMDSSGKKAAESPPAAICGSQNGSGGHLGFQCGNSGNAQR